jgi:hypothetical protein
VNYDILKSKERKNCMCTAMLWDPEEKVKEIERKMKEQEDRLKIEAVERLRKVARKQTLFERLEEKLRNSLKMIATIGTLFVKLLQN